MPVESNNRNINNGRLYLKISEGHYHPISELANISIPEETLDRNPSNFKDFSFSVSICYYHKCK